MEVEISFKLLLKTLLKHLWLLVIITLIVALLAALYTTYFVTPTYKATTTARILINDLNATAGSNLQTTINILSTYATSVLSDYTLQTASGMINNAAYTPEYLRRIISVNYDAGSVILHITAVSTSPENAAILANTVCEAAASCNTDLADLTVITRAVAPTSPASPSLILNVMLASVVAFILLYGIVLLHDLYNTKITTEEDLTQALDLPVIGAIPLLESLVAEKK